jgi:hypothetical protein
MLSWSKRSSDIFSLEMMKGYRVIAVISTTIDIVLKNLGAIIVMGTFIYLILF